MTAREFAHPGNPGQKSYHSLIESYHLYHDDFLTDYACVKIQNAASRGDPVA